jgi:aryl-alcohol dehydrogenase-like predicted oxidoreductase
MQARRLGHSDITVSQLCLGTMTFGAQNTAAEAHSQLDLALQNGVNFIDTAELYPAPASVDTYAESERIIGRWLKKQDRSRLVLATKVVGPAPKKWIGYIRNGPVLSQSHIETALHDSLSRLGTDYIDLFQIHWPARNTNYFGKLGYEYGRDKHDYPIEETLQTLARLQSAGKIRCYGVSNETPWGLHQYLTTAAREQLPDIVSVQNPYCLLNRTYEIGLAEFAHRSGIGLLAYSPLAGGSLSGKYLQGNQPEGARLTLHRNYFYRYTTARATEAIARYVDIANDFGIAPAKMAMAFVLRQPFVTSTIVGATNTQQLQENIDSTEIELSDEVIKAIQSVHNELPNPCP